MAINSYSFFVYGFLLIFISLFVFLFIPETKNKTAEEIVSEFNKFLIVKTKVKTDVY